MTMEVDDEDTTSTAQLPAHKIVKTAYEMLEESRISMEEIAAKMLFIKKEGRSKSELRELVTQMSLHLVNLRQANRSILLEEDRVKAETECAKTPVDFTTLQLHNLLYEKNHYVKAIKACTDFKSKYPDIELVPEEEFFSNAPKEIKETVKSSDSAHDLMLKRLHFELYQRKELCKLHEKLEQRKRSLAEKIANRKKFLSSLPSHLKSIKKASLPVQQQLDVLHTKKLKQHHQAELLPPALYVIYSQCLAQKEAFGESIDLEIVGNLKEAQAFAHKLANKDAGTSANTDTNKMEDDVLDEEDDGQRRRKRPKRAPVKDTLDQSGIYQSHPLQVILHIYNDEVSDPKPAKLVTLKFEYLLKLNVVCVGIEKSHNGPDSNILCNLFPDDTGTELPHQSAKSIAGDAVAFDEKRTSRPYKWAQHLAGIDFLPEVAPLLTGGETQGSGKTRSSTVVSGLAVYRQQNRIHTILERIRSREKAQLALAEQLESLLKLKWPTLSYDNVPWALHNPSCSLKNFSSVVDSLDMASSSFIVAMEQVAEPLDQEKSGRSKDEMESAREDGELPSVVQAPTSTNGVKTPSPKGPDPDHDREDEHSKSLVLISKSIVPSLNKSKSFKKSEENTELMLDSESDPDEQMEYESDNAANEIVGKAWEDYEVREFVLVLSRRMDQDERSVNLEAKIRITMEYPLRPPFFTLSLSGEKSSGRAAFDWYNELRSMEAEVNVHIAKMVPMEYENYILDHQVRFLAMLFDFHMDESPPGSMTKTSTSVVDVGLGKPSVSGKILARIFRGRDRRKMISWKDMDSTTPRYP